MQKMRQTNSLDFKRRLTSTKHGNEIFIFWGGEGRGIHEYHTLFTHRWVFVETVRSGRSVFGVIWSVSQHYTVWPALGVFCQMVHWPVICEIRTLLSNNPSLPRWFCTSWVASNRVGNLIYWYYKYSFIYTSEGIFECEV